MTKKEFVFSEVEHFENNIRAIQMVKELNSFDTPDDLQTEILSRYIGWGSLAKAFPNANNEFVSTAWEQRNTQLRDLLDDAEYERARASILDSFYTPRPIVDAMWGIASRLNADCGVILEPSCGTGHFINACPNPSECRFIGVEIDPITSRIAKFLHSSNAQIFETGFENVGLPEKSVDLVIANPPYGDFNLTLKDFGEFNSFSVHNQFILKSLKALKANRYAIFVVSRYVLDSSCNKARIEMSQLADLRYAFRLPSGVFKSEGVNTDVITDILVFKRKSDLFEEEAYQNPCDDTVQNWIYADVIHQSGDSSVYLNRYFNSSPNIAGGVEIKNGRFGAELHIEPSANPIADLMKSIELTFYDDGSINPSIIQTQQNFDGLISHIYITLSGKEIGVIDINEAGEMYRVIEQDVDYDFRYKTQVLSPDTVWSERYIAHISGLYYENIPTYTVNGDKRYTVDSKGYSTGRIIYERKFVELDDINSRSKLGKTRFEKLKLLTQIRDLLTHQLKLESTDADVEVIEENRVQLNAAYDRFFKKHGYINASATMNLIGVLPDAGLLLSLEMDYKKEVRVLDSVLDSGKKTYKIVKPETANKAAVFRQRVIYKNHRPTHADSPDHALSLSLSYYGAVNLAYMAQLLDCDEQDVLDEMHFHTSEPVIFFDAELGKWLHKSVFLSGNIRDKLEVAERAGDEIAVNALLSVMPERISLENISITLGAAWVPVEYYEQFIRNLTDDHKATVKYEPVSNIYEITCKPTEAKNTMFAVPGISFEALLDHVLNSKTIRIMRKISSGWGRETLVLDQEATELAIATTEIIKNEFAAWLYAQSSILEDLENIYNTRFNSLVAPNFDNYNVVIEGKVPDSAIRLNPHQVNAIYRGVLSEFTLYAHEVGAGKSFIAIARAMLRKQLGLSKKTIIVVPNHLVLQFASDIYRLFPSASVLAATPKDFAKKNRKRLICRIATGEYDLVVMSHSSFEFIKLSSSIQQNFIQEEIKLIEEAIFSLDSPSSRSAKNLEAMRKRAISRLDDVVNENRHDKLISFDMLGVDNLEVDEFHYYKNLQYHTTMTNIVGMGTPSGSYRAFDMYLKFKYLHQTHGSAGCYTGTPVSNSAVELYNLMRFMIPSELSKIGLDHFGNWARVYAENSTKFEASDTGKLKQVTRFAREWRNLSSMMGLWFQFADTISNSDLERIYMEKHGKSFPIPKLETGQRQTHVVRPTPEQQQLLDMVISRYEKLDSISDSVQRNAERLRLMDVARKLSTAARCVDSCKFRDEKGGKLEKIAKNVFSEYQKWDELKGTQVIFLDRSIPRSSSDAKVIKQYDEIVNRLNRAAELEDHESVARLENRLEQFNESEINEMRKAQLSNWSAYQEIKDLLIDMGMQPSQVRFIQEAKSDQDKQDMFDLVNDGEIRVLIGSTARMGCGTNIQRRLVHLHHADVGFLPSVITQREGRILRQGNMLYDMLGEDNFKVGISCYVTENSCDGRLWELNSIKLKMINILNNYNGEHSIDFGADADAISMKEIAALATGNPLMLERVELESEIQRLERLYQAHLRKQASIILKLSRSEKTLETAPNRLNSYTLSEQAYLPSFSEKLNTYNNFRVVIDGNSFSSRSKAKEYILKNKHSEKVYCVQGQNVIITKAKSMVDDYFKSRKYPFEFKTLEGDVLDDSVEAGAYLFNKILKNKEGVIGYIFNLPLTLEDKNLVLSTLDEAFILAYEKLDSILTSFTISKTLLDLVLDLSREFKDYASRINDSINEANNTVNQLRPLVDVGFDKQDTLAFKRLRLRLVQEALAQVNPEKALNEAIEIHQLEINALAEKMALESCKTPAGVVLDAKPVDLKVSPDVVSQAMQILGEPESTKIPRKNKRCKVVVNGSVVFATQIELF